MRHWRTPHAAFILGFFTAAATAGAGMIANVPLGGWRLVTDGVMGGISQGHLQTARQAGLECLHLAGTVDTRNDGGFIQAARDLGDLDPGVLARVRGVRLKVRGNDEYYNVHLRTSRLWLPWQAYRATFHATSEWQEVDIPLGDFQPYRTGTALDPATLTRIGIVAIGRDFTADLCIAAVTLR